MVGRGSLMSALAANYLDPLVCCISTPPPLPHCNFSRLIFLYSTMATYALPESHREVCYPAINVVQVLTVTAHGEVPCGYRLRGRQHHGTLYTISESRQRN
jgi:hypothetical protein